MTANHDEILKALKTLNVENDDHWTRDGLPRVESLGISGLSRKDVTEAAPGVTREAFTAWASPTEEETGNDNPETVEGGTGGNEEETKTDEPEAQEDESKGGDDESPDESTNEKDVQEKVAEENKAAAESENVFGETTEVGILIHAGNHPSEFVLEDQSILLICDVVQAAFENSGCKKEDQWNVLPDEDRERFIQEVVDGLKLYVEPLTDNEKEHAELLAKKAELEDEIGSLEEVINTSSKRLDKCRSTRDLLVGRLNVVAPPKSNQENIMAYIKTQNDQRAERASQAAQAKAVLQSIQAPIDVAMARKNTRGTQRPNMGNKNAKQG